MFFCISGGTEYRDALNLYFALSVCLSFLPGLTPLQNKLEHLEVNKQLKKAGIANS